MRIIIYMKKEPQKIAEEIKVLVDQLVVMAGKHPKISKLSSKQVNMTSTTKGASGALAMLIEEGFFDKPKDISSIMGKLKEIGRYYSRMNISMNLLNLTKRRTFNRFKDKETKNWQYVLRK